METKVVELDLNDVLPNRFQPRIKFSEESIQELAHSIKEHGVIQPIVVRNIGDKYEIIAGERRYKASILAGKQTIPAIITNLSEKDSAEVALIENVQRKDLTPIEEAISYKKILDMGYLTQDVLANKLGKTQSTIANKLRLLNLDDDVQEALLNEQISERHARSLLRLTSHSKQKEVLNKIINERLTVRKTDEVINNMMDDNNIEKLGFEEPAVSVNTNMDPIEELEVFNPSVETLNIPTAPIVDDSIPEIFPAVEPVKENTTNVFNPAPEVINSSVPPVPESVFDSIPEPIEELNFTNDTTSANIPSTPILEPQIENIPDSNINNPGFMDINKIENEASDIFTEKPLAPVENLLEPSSIAPDFVQPVEPVNDEDNEEEGAEDILVPGKFFNLLPEEEPEAPEIKPEPSNNFDFNFDVNSLNNIESTNNLPSLENIPLKPDLTLEEKPETIEPQPLLNPLVNDVYEQANPVPLAPELNNNLDTIAELNIPNNLGESYEKPIPKENISNVKSEPILNSTNNTLELKNAINMTRDFVQSLSKMGYIIDTEEFDFEDMYQIIFKINK